MPKEKLHYFVVEGTGTFPVDMLRYDSCWPLYESGAKSAYNILTPESLKDRAQPRQVALMSRKPPMRARWQSFGWDIVRGTD